MDKLGRAVLQRDENLREKSKAQAAYVGRALIFVMHVPGETMVDFFFKVFVDVFFFFFF